MSSLEALEAENYALRERVKALEAILGCRREVPVIFRLTAHEAGIFGLLLQQPEVSRGQAMDALYGHRPDADEPGERVIDVFVSRLRRKVADFGVMVRTQAGSVRGGTRWYLEPSAKAKVAEYLRAETEPANG